MPSTICRNCGELDGNHRPWCHAPDVRPLRSNTPKTYFVYYVERTMGAEDYELVNHTVILTTTTDVPSYLDRVAAFLEKHRKSSEFYTGAPRLLGSCENFVPAKDFEVWNETRFTDWVLYTCDTGRYAPPPDDFPVLT